MTINRKTYFKCTLRKKIKMNVKSILIEKYFLFLPKISFTGIGRLSEHAYYTIIKSDWEELINKGNYSARSIETI